jgi:hypothetical protein
VVGFAGAWIVLWRLAKAWGGERELQLWILPGSVEWLGDAVMVDGRMDGFIPGGWETLR